MPESATEWIASASIEEERVSRNAASLSAAIPTLAKSAATTALVPPSVDMGAEPSRTAAAQRGWPSPTCR